MRGALAWCVLTILARLAMGQPATPWLERLELSDLDGTYGFAVHGIDDEDYAGAAVAMVGDVNGDGVDDVAIGARGMGDRAGGVFVLFGRVRGAPFPASMDLADLSASDGFRLDGGASSDGLGYSVSAAGDVNADGLADLLVGAPGARSGAGDVYIVFGTREDVDVQRSILALGQGEAVRLAGRRVEGVNDRLGLVLTGLGDFNGDGVDDVAMGVSAVHAVFVVFGREGAWPREVDLRERVLEGGVEVVAGPGERFGGALSAGRVNGDDLGDLLIGAANASPGARDGAGSAYLLYGTRTPPGRVALPIIDPTASTRFDGLYEDGSVARAVAILGDINGDGAADVAVNRPYASTTSDARVTVRFGAGGVAPFVAIVPLWGTHPRIGFDVTPGYGRTTSGNTIASADVDADGIHDLIVGIPDLRYSADPPYAGRVYIFFGGVDREAVVTPHEAREGVSYVVGEMVEGYLGAAIAAGGDVNGDGIADLLIGEPTSRGDGPGRAYVVFGRPGRPCPVDFDGDGALTIFDFLLFQDVFQAGDIRADVDGDGALTIFDFLAFQTAFDAGCG
jgi:glycosylphosphatidylinositol phospholipase D